MEQSSKEKNQSEFRSFTPKEGVVAPEYVQIIEEHLRELLRQRDQLTRELPAIDPHDEKRFENIRNQIIIINDAIQRNATMISELMEGTEEETRIWLERGINPKKENELNLYIVDPR